MPPACPPCSLVCPSRVTPAPSAPAAASRQPTMTGMPAGRPRAAAPPVVSVPATSVAAARRGIFSSGTPSAAAVVSHHRSLRMSKK